MVLIADLEDFSVVCPPRLMDSCLLVYPMGSLVDSLLICQVDYLVVYLAVYPEVCLGVCLLTGLVDCWAAFLLRSMASTADLAVYWAACPPRLMDSCPLAVYLVVYLAVYPEVCQAVCLLTGLVDC
jgi:hypothetical protein